MTRVAKRNVIRSVLTMTGVCVSTASWSAQPIDVDVGVGLERHSNAARVSTDEQSDTARLLRAGIAWKDPVGPLSGDVDYRADRRDFIDNVQQDETAINGRAALKWDAAPRLLDVIVQHEISRTQTDLRTADTTNNRERRSVLTGGVDGYLHLSRVDSIILSPRYTDVSFSDSTQSDSRRADADATWQHELDPRSKLNTTVGVGRVRFDDSLQNYTSKNIQVSYETALARLSYLAGVGYSKFNREHLEDVNGNSLHLSLNYHGDSFDAGGNVVRELTDSSIGLVRNEFSLNNFNANDSNFDQVDVIQRDQFDLYWRQKLSAVTTLNFGIGGNRDDYKDTPRDQNLYYGQVDYRYTINARWSLELLGRYARTHFLDDPQDLEYKDKTYTASLQYRFTRHLDTQLSVSRENRSANVSTSDYTDNIAMVYVNYRFN